MEIKKTAVIGSGVIGTGWCTLFPKYGYETRLCDVSEEALERTRKSVETSYEQFINHGVMTREEADAALNRISYHKDIKEGIEGVDLIQENVPEKLDLKRSILATADEINPNAIYSTSVGSMSPELIQEESTCGYRFIAAHPYNPPHLMPIVELMGGGRTDQEYLDAAYDFYKKCKKEPIVLKKFVYGFPSNRLQGAYLRECVDLICKGVCTVDDIDRITQYSNGLRWGVIGQMMTLETCALGGIVDCMERDNHDIWEVMYEDMADWKKMPDNVIEIAKKGIDEAIEKRDPATGKTREEICKWRDDMYIEILKLTDHI